MEETKEEVSLQNKVMMNEVLLSYIKIKDLVKIIQSFSEEIDPDNLYEFLFCPVKIRPQLQWKHFKNKKRGKKIFSHSIYRMIKEYCGNDFIFSHVCKMIRKINIKHICSIECNRVLWCPKKWLPTCKNHEHIILPTSKLDRLRHLINLFSVDLLHLWTRHFVQSRTRKLTPEEIWQWKWDHQHYSEGYKEYFTKLLQNDVPPCAYPRFHINHQTKRLEWKFGCFNYTRWNHPGQPQLPPSSPVFGNQNYYFCNHHSSFSKIPDVSSAPLQILLPRSIVADINPVVV